MLSTISDHWLSYLGIPLAACSISLLTWRLLVRRGWNRRLPVLNLYVIFSALTSVTLLPLFYLQLYPGTFCRLYAGGYQITSFMIPLLLAAVIVELTKHVSGQDAAARRSYTVTVTGGMVILLTLSACMIVIQGGAAHGLLEMVFTGASRASSVVIIALVLGLLVVRRRRFFFLQGDLTLIPIIVGAYYLLDLVSSFIVFRRGGTTEQGLVVQQTLWLVYATVFYWVLAREPETPQGAFLPTER
jgi:hypothetical protein